MEPVLIGGTFRAAKNPRGTFSAREPRRRAELPERYPVSSFEDVEAALSAARDCVTTLGRAAPESIARFLESYAEKIEEHAGALVEIASRETGLPPDPRLQRVELPRTTQQLRFGAEAVRDGTWMNATIDTNANLRSAYGPLGGAVVVFGPNNFPLAFNAISGGDFVAAFAARNPVLAKVHPWHPGTSKKLAALAREALAVADLPPAAVQMLYALEPEDGLAMVEHPLVAAVAFTGGRPAGLALKQAADRAGKPCYLELSSVNPLFVLPGALAERGPAIATELASSCLLGTGQFCTNPGITVVPETETTEAFIEKLRDAFEKAPTGTLLGPAVEEGLVRSVRKLVEAGARVLTGGERADGDGYTFQNTLLEVSGDAFLARTNELQEEAFGPVNLVVRARDPEQLLAVANAFGGNLTASVYSHTGEEDDTSCAELSAVLRSKVGRLLNDKMPTGVAVSAAMNHGGPYPATGHPGFTSVGIPASLRRFAALHCYDNVRANRLPRELADANPNGLMWRTIDGVLTRADVKANAKKR